MDLQPKGFPLPGWQARSLPSDVPMVGRYCRIERLQPRHGSALFAADQRDAEGTSWTYLPYGPFPDAATYGAWIADMAVARDPLFYAILNESGQAVGVASYLRIDPAMGTIEVGHIHYSPLLQRTRAATEAMYLLARRVFDELGYRRYEWKCDALNAPSRRGAERLGFAYEGTFRQAAIYKNRNRDTAWYAMIDREWPAIRAAFERWLDPSNFDAAGAQKRALESFRT
ncbi:MAG TPA: GNAT family protein [Dongiaceae bacterium]|jgi:RimJ/RimL family protein N-acetyltransferase|nr:GNAT family protein [Dongiaceae bacterium]